MRKVCRCHRHAACSLSLLRALLFLLALLSARVRCDCTLGILKPTSGWTVISRHIVYSVVPGIIPPEDKTTQTSVPVRPSEALIYAEVRPPAAPAQDSLLCLRSMSSVSAACSGGRAVPAADSPAPTDPESFLFNVTEGFPQGPCIPLNAAGDDAQLKQDRPRPDDCWPGAGYCSDSSTKWSVMPTESAAQQLVLLQVVRTVSTYQDTDGSTDVETITIPFQVTDGCVLQVAASKPAAAARARHSCLACNGKLVSVQSITQSNSCMHCPVRSSKAREPMALVPGSSSWKCIPGMPKGFEAIAVRMGPGGNPQCASADGKTCLRNIGKAVTCQAIAALLNTVPVSRNKWQPAGVISARVTAEAGVALMKPLTCGAAHAAVWPRVTGYSTPGHWCTVARNWLQDRQPQVQGRCIMQP